MSLQYEKEVEEISPEQTENVQRVLPVFPVYSVIIVACLIAVFVCQVIVDGQDSILTGGPASVDLAGFDKPLFAAGDYWRILTGAVLHGGLIHLIFNCYALYSLGRIIETLSNRAHLAVVFLLAAIGGGLLSLAFLPAGTSIGASGGIIGFLGYLTVYCCNGSFYYSERGQFRSSRRTSGWRNLWFNSDSVGRLSRPAQS
jgi:membrane associated rhomboid family serine protease